MALARDVAGQPSPCGVVFFMSQFTIDEATGNRFSLRTGLESFETHAGKAVAHRISAQFKLFAIDFLSGRHNDIPTQS